MARHAFETSMSVPPVRSGGGWKALLGFTVAAAGVGFAGYVFLVPYHQMQSEVSRRAAELELERSSVQETVAERDKLKASLATFTEAEKQKAAADARHKTDADALAAQLKPGLESLGATIAVAGGGLQVSFPSDKVVDSNGIDVSEAGLAALKIFAGAVKKGARARITAVASPGPPPRELKTLFHSAGELHAVRAARVMSALQDAGMPPGSVLIVGEAEKTPPHGHGKKAPAPADRLDIQVELQ